MSTRVVRAAVLCVISAFTLAGCESDVGSGRLGDIPENTSRDSVLTLLGQGPLSATGNDTMRVLNGYRRQTFAVRGGTFEVIYYREAPGSINDTIARTVETPVIIKDGRYLGHGWSFYTDIADSLNLPNPLRTKERLDSVARLQQPK